MPSVPLESRSGPCRICEHKSALSASGDDDSDAQKDAHRSRYDFCMGSKRPRTRVTLARNLRTLMDKANWSQRDLEARSGVSQRQISNILTESTSCSVETAEALGRAFGLTGWQLLLPDMPMNGLRMRGVEQLLSTYMLTDEETRDFIDTIVKRELAAKPPEPSVRPPKKAS